jgi:18S rRNA (guanine1575-N7)-methyltransferase
MSRPEHIAPPEIFYDDKEAKKYATNSRMVDIQSKMSERALELLNLTPGPKLLLDIGCGTGLSGKVLEEQGHIWFGIDISQSMLEVGKERGNHQGDTMVWDMGAGLSFQPGSLDGAISISAIQWLCNADKTNANPIQRMKKFFESLYICLARGSRAVLQFYPETPQQMELLTSSAMRAGFTGGVLIDYPNSAKAKKYFLVLFAGSAPQMMPKGLGTDESNVANFVDKRRTLGNNKKKDRPSFKSKEWILNKKERREKLGLKTVGHSKYTGRKRPGKF